jgi:UDP-N-acetyl-D-mannosaminuronic acid transferase (WecB/TagA/CpsF family)
VGASLDFVAGRVRRAPVVFQKVGLEWAYRIYTDPARLAPRYAKNAVFLFKNVARELTRKAAGTVEPIRGSTPSSEATPAGDVRP